MLCFCLFLDQQGGRGQRGAPGPTGDNGIGLPGPKVSCDFARCLQVSSPTVLKLMILFFLQGDKGNQGKLGPPGPMARGEPGTPVSH